MVDDSQALNMSPMASTILRSARRMIPPMLENFHKGQLGRVGVIGGSEDYTGAPYFSASASAKLGCDMSHVICTPGAGAVIKTYSPNLMVHPLMRQSHDHHDHHDSSGGLDIIERAERVSRRIIAEMLPRLHVLVIGPGLGRDPLMQETVAQVMSAAREKGMPLVLDADALQVVQRQPDLIRGYANAVLTPNVVEFKRLCEAFGVKDERTHEEDERGGKRVELLAKTLGGVTIIQKGQKDFISNGSVTLVNDLEGGRKRSGGQGDTLTGAVATFLGWRKAYLDRLWEEDDEDAMLEPRLGEEELMGLAAFGGSAITRECSRLAFLEKGRSLQASDLTEQVHAAFLGLFGEK